MFSSKTLRTAALIVLALALHAPGTLAAQAPPAQADQARGEYLIGAQDVLTVTVWDSPDLSGKFTVETDGSFTFP